MTDALIIPTGQDAEYLAFATDGSGWCRLVSEAFPAVYSGGAFPQAASIYLRLAQLAAPGPFAAREVHVAFMAGLGTRSLRDVPLGRIEAAANTPGHHEILAAFIKASADAVVPLPSELIDIKSNPHLWASLTRTPPARRSRLRLRVRVPAGHRKPDEFYQQIAERFAYLRTVSPRPAAELADANDVPVTTVHGWVKEARRRGLLPGGERDVERGDQR